MFVKEIEASELATLLAKHPDLTLIDVRTPAEIAAGVIPGTLAMPLTVLPLRIAEIPRDKQVVFYCRTGARSAQACLYLAQQGYDQVYNLRGGIINWAGNGLSIVSGADLLP